MEIVVSEEKGVRMLHFGSQWVQGAMRIARPNQLELEYTREMMSALLFLDEAQQPGWRGRVLCIGLGVAAIPKFLHKHFPKAHITVVEISPAVHAAACMHFKCPPQGENFHIHIACGAQWLGQSTAQFDLIVVDGFDSRARVGPLNSLDFYTQARQHLASGGVLVSNILSGQKDTEPSQQRLKTAFDQQAVVLAPCQSGNRVGLAFESSNTWLQAKPHLQMRSEQLRALTGLVLAPSLPKLNTIN